jgi:hypothetical protein
MISIAKGDPVNGRITGYYAQPRNPVEKVEIRGLPASGPLRGTAGQVRVPGKPVIGGRRGASKGAAVLSQRGYGGSLPPSLIPIDYSNFQYCEYAVQPPRVRDVNVFFLFCSI